MNRIERKVNTVLARTQIRRRRNVLVLLLACLVAACTFYGLHREGITMTYQKRVMICAAESGKVSHVHNDDCYLGDMLACPLDEIEPHEHTPDCYEPVLICGCEESQGHQHDENCWVSYTVNVCGLEEHIHDERCYGTILVCAEEEREEKLDENGEIADPGHTHTGSCYETVLICGQQEHVHGDACFDTRRELACGLEEGAGVHHHDESCYESVLTCDKPVLPVHIHTAECFRMEEMTPEEIAALGEDEAAEEAEATEEAGKPEDTQDPDELEKTEEAEAQGESETPEKSKEAEESETKEKSETEPLRFSATAENILVTVEADADAFPDGTEIMVKPVYDDAVISSVTDAVEGTVFRVQAVDITFLLDGEEIEPAKPIRVTMTPVDLPEIAAPVEDAVVEQSVVHVDHEGEASVVTQEENIESEMVFDAESFSVYALVYSVIEKTITASDGNSYRINVTYDAAAEIPLDAVLSVEEILPPDAADGTEVYGSSGTALYEEYMQKTEEALGWEAGSVCYARFFDITILSAEGEKLQPANGSSVAVRIELADSASEELSVVHFADGAAEGEKIESSTENSADGATVQFQADSFSVYSIVDAPEPISGDLTVSDLSAIEPDQAYYLSIARNGTNYMTTNRVLYSSTYELQGTTAVTDGEKWFFEFPEDGKVYLYYLDATDARQYLNVDNNRNISFSANPQALSIANTDGNAGTFYIYTLINNKNYALSVRSIRNFFFEQRDNGAHANERVVLTKYVRDPYELDGKTFGIAYNDNSATAAALTATATTNGNRLAGLDMLIRTNVLSNDGILLVAENSDIQEWTFECVEGDHYYIKTTVDGATKYLVINRDKVSLTDDQASASIITATPGTEANSGKWHFTVNGYSLNFAGSTANNFNAANNSNAFTWLNLVEKSSLTADDFVNYSARKISASDEVLSATEKDENGEILKDEEGNVVYKQEKAKVIIYTRVWDDVTKRYDYYAVDHDGSLLRVYDNGDLINWVGNQVNSALWEFTEYTNEDGTPSYYYELENTAYGNTFLAPQSGGIISDHKVGVNMEGRQEGFDYTDILAWDEAAYAYSGLKVENGRVVTCPKDDSDDFYFAVMIPNDESTPEEAAPTSTVATVDNNEHGITIRMIDFNNQIISVANGKRDSVQTSYFGSRPWHENTANTTEAGLVSTNLTGGYPTITANTAMQGSSLANLFSNMTPANHLFIQSVYNESGYFEYDSTQNFAHLNDDGNFTVYDQLGAIGTSTGATRTHGQFMPYNDISAEVGYAHDTNGNLITNKTDVLQNELPDSDPRKGEPLYSIPDRKADYYFGMELSASFTQTPNGLDNWGHDIIFEFTGDDDFWFYVDGELVLDLGGVHSALPGSVNFRTGEVVCNTTVSTLYDIFKSHYQARGMTESEIDNRLNELFEQKEVDGRTVHVFKDYTQHTMKMFYMERGAGASNLKMRFNLASVQPSTVELSKKLNGTQGASNKLIQYPYQIWYQEPIYGQDEHGNQVVVAYEDPIQMVQGSTASASSCVVYKGTKKLVPYKDSLNIGGKEYTNVFLLKPEETAVIRFPDQNCKYEIIECGVDTEVYDQVSVNGEVITGSLYNNTDTGSPAGTEDLRQDFGIVYELTGVRPRVEYTNEVAPDAMRTLSFTKVVYDANGHPMTPEQTANVSAKFRFRLYLGNEFADEQNLSPANMYSYFIKNPAGNYCRWNAAGQEFESLGITAFEGAGGLAEYLNGAGSGEKSSIVFTTSLNGSIANIPAGYTVEVRDLIVGSRFKVEEPDREIPKGFTRRDSDGYVRTDLEGGSVVYYTAEGVYGRHPAAGSTITAEPISDTIVSKTESPRIEIRNQEGWGLTAQKIWTDRDFMTHDPIFMAVYLAGDNDDPGTLIEGTVRRLSSSETEIYWFFPDLKINDQTYRFDQFIIREVELTGSPTVDANTGVVSGYDSITPVPDGGSISVSGRTISGTDRTETYTVAYQRGDSTGQNANIRTDIVTNSRPGIQIYKTNWEGDKILSGAVFTLKDSNGHDVGAATYTSDSEGLVTTAYLSEGTFTLDEIRTPQGYVALDEPITINVTTTETVNPDLTVTVGTTTYYVTLTGPENFFTATQATESAMARITVKNRDVQGLKVYKVGVDGNIRTPLGGVHFALYDQVKDGDGNLRPAYTPKAGYEDVVTDEDGLLAPITMDLGAGTYYLREKVAPSGYKKLANDLCFTIGENGTVRINNTEYKHWLSTFTDPSDSGKVSYQIEIENTVLGITIRKTDEKRNPLPGAIFKLCIKNDQGVYEAVSEYGLGEEGILDLTTAAEKTFSGLRNGFYKLTETHAPGGYIIHTKDIYFEVSDGAVALKDETGHETTYPEASLIDNNTTIVVKNIPGTALPMTGGIGTTLFTALGGLMTAIAGAFLIIRRKKTV